MNAYDYIQLAKQNAQDPKAQWQWALGQRTSNPDPNLANAEHYLWNAYYSGQGPLQAAGGLLTPFGYYIGKSTGLLGGRSEPSLDQLRYGLMGAFKGILD